MIGDLPHSREGIVLGELGEHDGLLALVGDEDVAGRLDDGGEGAERGDEVAIGQDLGSQEGSAFSTSTRSALVREASRVVLSERIFTVIKVSCLREMLGFWPRVIGQRLLYGRAFSIYRARDPCSRSYRTWSTSCARRFRALTRT